MWRERENRDVENRGKTTFQAHAEDTTLDQPNPVDGNAPFVLLKSKNDRSEMIRLWAISAIKIGDKTVVACAKCPFTTDDREQFERKFVMLVRSLRAISEPTSRFMAGRSGRAPGADGPAGPMAARHGRRGATRRQWLGLRLGLGAAGRSGCGRFGPRCRSFGVVQQVVHACLGGFVELEVVAAGVADVERPDDLGEEVERRIGIPRRGDVDALS